MAAVAPGMRRHGRHADLYWAGARRSAALGLGVALCAAVVLTCSGRVVVFLASWGNGARGGTSEAASAASVCGRVVRASSSQRLRPCLGASSKLLDKLKQKAQQPKPELSVTPEQHAAISSALPPGSDPPPERARLHEVLRANPQLLESITSAKDLEYAPMDASDAAELSDLALEFFPEENFPGPEKCGEFLSHEGVVAWKATVAVDGRQEIAGIAITLATKAALEQFVSKASLDGLRQEVMGPRTILFDEPECRSLSYIHSVGVVSELRRRGVAAELLRRSLEDVRSRAAEKGQQGLKAVALHVPDYNVAATRGYEKAGFERVQTIVGAYDDANGRSTNGYMYAWYPPLSEAEREADAGEASSDEPPATGQ
eukprot:CAMPEP_0203881058 /NCGR_PEP_ID=MMETSP0359-20131031/25412_1 /ASSEMBLY_ACC=CAM_ASM_000338 /TAXON_ID=268821 /ORGANISM="Scrippsiella Hangoei, Strain SHTV-5" /LENGTH=371 /DNA_ID=CAMNT_0050800807 /DNA_START=42 /DNA_END=1155 /DNA_ORIENTATION=+